MTLEETIQLYASVLRQLLPAGGYDASPDTEVLAVDIYAHAKVLAQADIDAHRLLQVLETIPVDLLADYEREYGLPMQCMVPGTQSIDERINVLRWVRTNRNVLNRSYIEQLLAIFGVTLVDIIKYFPMQCTAPCDAPVNTEQLRYKVFLRLQYPMTADMSCIIENYLPAYLRVDWVVDMPWGEWILNSEVTFTTNSTAHYTAFKTNQREYYDSYANLDLAAAIVRSLSDTDMQQWQAVKDAVNELTGVTNWVLDPANNQIVYTEPQECNLNNCSPTVPYIYEFAGRYPGVYFSTIEQACAFYDIHDGNAWYGSVYAEGNYCRSDALPIVEAPSMYSNPAYDPTAEEEQKTLPLAVVAQKVISNASSSNEAISLLAEAYLEAVANSIFNTDPSKQFVKLSDLFSQFELNKTLRT